MILFSQIAFVRYLSQIPVMGPFPFEARRLKFQPFSCFHCIPVFEQLSKWVQYTGGLIPRCMNLEGWLLSLLLLNEGFKSVLSIRQAYRKLVGAKDFTLSVKKWCSKYVIKMIWDHLDYIQMDEDQGESEFLSYEKF